MFSRSIRVGGVLTSLVVNTSGVSQEPDRFIGNHRVLIGKGFMIVTYFRQIIEIIYHDTGGLCHAFS